jgi:uncharacterized membrane protein
VTAAAPATWARIPSAAQTWVIGLALVGAAISAYLALFQLRLVSNVWDPVFGPASSEAVLSSSLSRSLPVSDAAVGAVAYLMEALLGLASHRLAWGQLAFAALLVGLAATGLVLVLAQLVLVHAACALCICSAAISFLNVTLGRADVAAAARRVTHFGGHRKS